MLVLNQRVVIGPSSELGTVRGGGTLYRLRSGNRSAERYKQGDAFQGKISEHAGAIKENRAQNNGGGSAADPGLTLR